MNNRILTLSMENQFSFTCPIMNADVQMRSCVVLRDRVYSAKRVETRRGCQACISSGKCPAAEIIRRFAFGSNFATEQCASTEEKKGKLPVDVLERIAPVLVRDSLLNAYGVTQEERDLIESSRGRIETQMQTAPGNKRVQPRFSAAPAPTKGKSVSRSSQRAAERDPAPKTTTPTSKARAASTGDLGAALNTEEGSE